MWALSISLLSQSFTFSLTHTHTHTHTPLTGLLLTTKNGLNLLRFCLTFLSCVFVLRLCLTFLSYVCVLRLCLTFLSYVGILFLFFSLKPAIMTEILAFFAFILLCGLVKILNIASPALPPSLYVKDRSSAFVQNILAACPIFLET